jgi:23S rRNA (cytosine1962-C5)-methyltransferase
VELRATDSGGVGLFPEQLANVAWLEGRIAARAAGRGDRPDGSPLVLNLFAHTGLLTLAAARAGAAVVHVDAARSAVAWARRNADIADLADRPIRWLVDDAAAFVARESRRGRRYDGLILDPPSFGRAGGAGRAGRGSWRLADDLPALLEACAAIAADGAFVLVSAHTTGLDGADLSAAVGRAFGVGRTHGGGRSRAVASLPLGLDAESGARLDLGWAVRLD